MTATGGTRSAFSTHSLSLPARRPSGRVLGLCPLHGGGNRGSGKTASPGISATEAGVGPRTHARPGSCQALVRFMRSACGHMVTGSPPKCRAPARCQEAHGGHLAELPEIRPVSGSEDKQEKSRWGERESERTRGGGLGSIVWPSGAAVPKPGVPAHGTSQCTLLCPQDILNWASDTGNGKTLVNMGVTAAPWGK